jgi:hypothetical protein
MNWVKKADEIPISPLTSPDTVLQFIDNHPGLFETCRAFPWLVAEYAPQLTIPGMGGELEPVFEEHFQESLEKHEALRRANSSQGSALTTNSACPLCDEEWALRHPTFGDYQAVYVAHAYFNGGLFGPKVSPYDEMDHVLWLLSGASNWLPRKIRDYMLDGMTHGLNWSWERLTSGLNRGCDWSSIGALHEHMLKCLEKNSRFTWTQTAKDDALQRIKLSVKTLSLPESPDELFNKFLQYKFPQNYIAAERNLRHLRSGKNEG